MINSNTVYNAVCQELKRHRHGERFQSIRELMQRYATSQRNVEAVLHKLVNENKLTRIPGEGYYVRDQAAQRTRSILLLTPDFPSWLYTAYEAELQRQIAAEEGLVLRRGCRRDGVSLSDSFPHNDIDAVIVVTDTTPFSLKDLNLFMAAPFPVVVLDSEMPNIAVSSVNNNNIQSGIMAAACLLNHGHRNLAILISEPLQNLNIQQRIDSFCNYAVMHNAPVKLIDCKSKHGDFSEIAACDQLQQYLERNGLDFTGVFVVSDASAMGVYKALQLRGIRIPEDVSIISHDGIPQANLLHPSLTTVAIDIQAQVTALLNGLREQWQNREQVFHVRTAPKIVFRDSVINHIPQL